MKISQALQSEISLGMRVSCGDKWLIFDDVTNEWVVNQRKYGQKKTREILRTENEDEAVKELRS